MAIELCGEDTPNGPCNMPKDHAVQWHRNRTYTGLEWTIYGEDGTTKVSEGRAFVPLNQAITAAREKNGKIRIDVEFV